MSDSHFIAVTISELLLDVVIELLKDVLPGTESKVEVSLPPYRVDWSPSVTDTATAKLLLCVVPETITLFEPEDGFSKL
jgi:hypothetical protein